MASSDYPRKRQAFLQAFEDLRIKNGLDQLPPWFHVQFPDDKIMATWCSSMQQRVMTIQEADADRLFGFDAFVAKTGLDDELLCLTLDVENTPAKVTLIFEVYRLWFVDKMPWERLEPLVDEFIRAYAKEGACLGSLDEDEDSEPLE
ncbi:hypothetical protein LVJ94_24490 [Pendulispora rubella]|uniref:Uncharacterized protein n=1 Tax=Pendulispora rubella TaxID=2741070 RepID=A0ABZ2LHE9_9BACT